jgi:hypothetical protein
MIIESDYELLALHSVLYEARFRTDPSDDEIPGSGILAELHKRIVDALLQIETKRGETRFAEWLAGDHTPEIDIAKARLQKVSPRWGKFSAQVKREYILNLVAPFQISEEKIAELIVIGDVAAN